MKTFLLSIYLWNSLEKRFPRGRVRLSPFEVHGLGPHTRGPSRWLLRVLGASDQQAAGCRSESTKSQKACLLLVIIIILSWSPFCCQRESVQLLVVNLAVVSSVAYSACERLGINGAACRASICGEVHPIHLLIHWSPWNTLAAPLTVGVMNLRCFGALMWRCVWPLHQILLRIINVTCSSRWDESVMT